MAQLIVRKLPAEVVLALKKRAAANGRSAEAEHRAILTEVLTPSAARAMTFKEFLLTMPDVGDDDDFERMRQDMPRDVEL